MEMTFDVSQQKKKLQSDTQNNQTETIEAKIPKVTDSYPVVGMLDNNMCVTNEGAPEYSYYIQVVPRDLTDLSDKESEEIKKLYWDFQKTFGHSLKEIYLPFKEENRKQQEYVNYKLNYATQAFEVRELQNELAKLKSVEQFYVSFRSFVVIYASSQKELDERLEEFIGASNVLFSPRVMSRNEVTSLLNKLNNMGGNN